MGFSSLKWLGDEVLAQITATNRKTLNKCGAIVRRKAQAGAPVGTEIRGTAKKGKNAGKPWTERMPGTLKKGIRYRVTRSGDKVQVIAGGRSGKSLTAYYAMWAEYGNAHMLARPFMRPALFSSGPEIEAQFKETMK